MSVRASILFCVYVTSKHTHTHTHKHKNKKWEYSREIATPNMVG